MTRLQSQASSPALRSRRLWHTLARPVERPAPAKGLDLVGEWIHGRIHHARTTHDSRERATRIAELADTLRNHSDAALADYAEPVIDAARLESTRPEARDASTDNAFALLTEVIRRELGLSLHVEQIMGALAMAQGAAAEMATGEGKTITAILPTALLAWRRKGVHVITVNDYLATRDAEIVAPCLRRVGLTVASITNDSKQAERRAAYDADVTYAADKQIVFDFLRDRLKAPTSTSITRSLIEDILDDHAGDWHDRVVQRGLHAAVVDEADSVLIDEAVTPAIISADPADDGGDPNDPARHHRIAAQLARELEPDRDYTLDRRARHIALTDQGRQRLAEAAGSLPAFWAGARRREELIKTALTAKELMTLGDDYILKDGKTVEIIDRSTGRVLEGRRWQQGLHQAVEAKEGVELSEARRTSSRIGYARFFQRYRHLCGMSGTIFEVRDELWRTYRLPVIRIPTHKPIARTEAKDAYHLTEDDKINAVVTRVREVHAKGQPILVGTRSVLTSERIASELQEAGIPCRVLNAEREKEEAEIVAQAGKARAVTVATNMAGRGTDIKLDHEARDLGGLLVIGTERHQERRVDRQLVGRAGRQGDPGRAEMHVSFDDDLIRLFGLTPLAALARRWTMLRPLLWNLAQAAGSARARATRASSAHQENWLEFTLHSESR
jgi:preprotein translocase subunit SecA